MSASVRFLFRGGGGHTTAMSAVFWAASGKIARVSRAIQQREVKHRNDTGDTVP